MKIYWLLGLVTIIYIISFWGSVDARGRGGGRGRSSRGSYRSGYFRSSARYTRASRTSSSGYSSYRSASTSRSSSGGTYSTGSRTSSSSGYGSSRSSSSSGYSSSRSTNSDSNGQSFYSPSAGRYEPGGSRQYSRYITYVPPVRYNRAYGAYRGYYYHYYSQYFTYYSTANYRYNSYGNNKDVGVCVNYEAHDDGGVLGVFVCPLGFEPESFTACCGHEYAEYCCEPINDSFHYYVHVILVCLLIGACILAIIIYCCCKAHKAKQMDSQTNSPVLKPKNKFRTGGGSYPLNYGYDHQAPTFSSGSYRNPNSTPRPPPQENPALPRSGQYQAADDPGYPIDNQAKPDGSQLKPVVEPQTAAAVHGSPPPDYSEKEKY